MNLLAAIADSLWTASSLPACARFRRALDRPEEAQRELLRRYLSRNEDSAYGRRFGFAAIRTYEEFARQVPLTDYEELAPWIVRIRNGENQVLTREPVSNLVPTSGSSDGRKLIPFTADLQRDFNRAIGPWIVGLHREYPSIGFGKAYWSITPAVPIVDCEPSAVPIGFEADSAYLGGIKKRLVESTLAAPSELRNASDLDVFRYLTLLCLVRESDLRLISIWHPSFLFLLLDALPANWESLLRDLNDGSCRYGGRVSDAVRRALKLRPVRRRARALAKIDPTDPPNIWPALKLISCWGDANAEIAANALQRRFPHTLVQRKGLLATEAFVTVPFAGSRPLAVRSHFFEFIDPGGRIRLAHELRPGETYEVVVTTGGGLYRYRLRDQVEVTDPVARTPSLRFLGRTGNVSDRCGEKLSEVFVGQVLQDALVKLTPRFALLAPEVDESTCCYTLFIEGETESKLAMDLDNLLKQNPHYAWCRQLGQLQSPQVFRIQSGGYETFVGRERLRGMQLGEIKPSPLSLHTDWSTYFKGSYMSAEGILLRQLQGRS